MSVLFKRGGNLICFWGNKGNGGEHGRAGTGFPNPFLMNGKKQKRKMKILGRLKSKKSRIKFYVGGKAKNRMKILGGMKKARTG